jgi:hypothetical protein
MRLLVYQHLQPLKTSTLPQNDLKTHELPVINLFYSPLYVYFLKTNVQRSHNLQIQQVGSGHRLVVRSSVTEALRPIHTERVTVRHASRLNGILYKDAS